MATDLDKIAAAFSAMASVAFPDGYLAELELAVVYAHLETTRAERAAHLLATRGPDEAALMLGCSRGHVYVLAAQKVRKQDESQTKAA